MRELDLERLDLYGVLAAMGFARETYRTLSADLTDLHRQQRTRTMYCGAGPIGITRRRT